MNDKTPIENIKLSFSCSKDYEKMSPCTSGRHCDSCNKTVIDFSNKNLSDLTNALEKYGTVCGRFTKEQLSRKVKKSWNFNRIAAGLFLACGLGIFNKELKAQEEMPDSLNRIAFPNNKPENLYFSVGEIIEIIPVYKNGGDEGLRKFLNDNINFPADTLNGKVIVQFTVDTSGKVINPKILKSLSPDADCEVLRVIKLLEFAPATRMGKKISTSYNLPVKFHGDGRKK